LTKKNAISSIEKDYNNYKNDFILTLINYESIHKLENDDFDLLVLDEAHSKLATFPKQSKTNKEIKSKYSHLPIIYLS
jgi:superfamily II DNA or RNA helicase